MRTSLACDICRSSKLRCKNNSDISKPQTCERCQKLNLKCYYTPKPSQIKKIKNKQDPSKSIKTSSKRKSSSSSSIGKESSQPNSKRKTNPNHETNGINESIPECILPEKKILFEIAQIFFENQYKGTFPFIHKKYFLRFLNSKKFNPETYFNDYLTLLVNDYDSDDSISILNWPDPIILLGVLALCARFHPILVHRYGKFSEQNNPHQFIPDKSPFPEGASNNGEGILLHSLIGGINSTSFKYSNTQHLPKVKIPSGASNYFGWHARCRFMRQFDKPSIQRVQALIMLTSHEWGEANVPRSYMYIGIASRMASVLGLVSPNSVCYRYREIEQENDTSKETYFGSPFTTSTISSVNSNGTSQQHEFILAEAKRRTLWSVYMMDRCISSGKDRSPAIKIDDIKIPTPCTESDFTNGNSVRTLTFNEAREVLDKKDLNKISTISCHGYILLTFEIWAKIAKWVGEIGGRKEVYPPWDYKSKYYILSQELDQIEFSLSEKYQLDSRTIEQLQHKNDFEKWRNSQSSETNEMSLFGSCGYLHCLILLCRIFLNREYFFLNPDYYNYLNHNKNYDSKWWGKSTSLLLKAARKLSDLISTLTSISAMVIAPLTGFELFTVAGVNLYFSYFPSHLLERHIILDGVNNDDMQLKKLTVEKIKREAIELANSNINLLETRWSNIWSLAISWVKLTKRTNIIMPQVIGNESSVKKNELKMALQNYGSGEIHDADEEIIKIKKEKHELLIKSLDVLNNPTGTNPNSPGFHFSINNILSSTTSTNPGTPLSEHSLSGSSVPQHNSISKTTNSLGQNNSIAFSSSLQSDVGSTTLNLPTRQLPISSLPFSQFQSSQPQLPSQTYLQTSQTSDSFTIQQSDLPTSNQQPIQISVSNAPDGREQDGNSIVDYDVFDNINMSYLLPGWNDMMYTGDGDPFENDLFKYR